MVLQNDMLHVFAFAEDELEAAVQVFYVRGGRIINWPVDRKAISMAGNLYIKAILGMPVNDATAGYRVR